MGKTTEETLKEIEQTRDSLGEKVDLLVDQVRQKTVTAGVQGLKVAGIALGVAAAFFLLRRMRR
ncbi:MAG: hypothetical protein ACRDI1_12305 [Actinomycetota bacterium]